MDKGELVSKNLAIQTEDRYILMKTDIFKPKTDINIQS